MTATIARPTPAPSRVAAVPRCVPALAAGVASALALMAGPALAAEDWTGGPRYSSFDAGYQWTDSLYGVKVEGGQHEGVKLAGSVGIAEFGRVGLHLFGEFFDGDFTGVSTTCDGGEGGSTVFSGDRGSQALAGGLGASYALSEATDVVVRAAYVDISEFETPNSQCQLVSGDDTGYFGEVMFRSEFSEKVELEAGFRYSSLDDSDASDSEVILGIGYNLTDYLALRARGVVFDDDTGIELGARLYFGNFLGRDTIF